MRNALKSLTSREENIIRLRFGIGDSNEKDKKYFSLSRNEVKEIRRVAK